MTLSGLRMFPAYTALILAILALATVAPLSAQAQKSILLALAEDSTREHIDENVIDEFMYRIDANVREKVLLLSAEREAVMPIPILFDVTIFDLKDSWLEPRPNNRKHYGIDIMAQRGALIVSPTRAVVTNIGWNELGGNFVITANPGGEQLYYAHMERVADDIFVGDVLMAGDPIGYVGTSGNAGNTEPHLHLGMYYKKKPVNPYPRLLREFFEEERLATIDRILDPKHVRYGKQNDSIALLQEILIEAHRGIHALELSDTGATGYFGPQTLASLTEYRLSYGIGAHDSYYDALTQALVVNEWKGERETYLARQTVEYGALALESTGRQ